MCNARHLLCTFHIGENLEDNLREWGLMEMDGKGSPQEETKHLFAVPSSSFSLIATPSYHAAQLLSFHIKEVDGIAHVVDKWKERMRRWIDCQAAYARTSSATRDGGGELTCTDLTKVDAKERKLLPYHKRAEGFMHYVQKFWLESPLLRNFALAYFWREPCGCLAIRASGAIEGQFAGLRQAGMDGSQGLLHLAVVLDRYVSNHTAWYVDSVTLFVLLSHFFQQN